MFISKRIDDYSVDETEDKKKPEDGITRGRRKSTLGINIQLSN